MNYEDMPLCELLQKPGIFEIFDDEFHKDSWLDVTVLLASDSSLKDIVADGTVPDAVVARICDRLDQIFPRVTEDV